jgi:hypothetical protein
MSEGGIIRMIGDILCENVSEVCSIKSYESGSCPIKPFESHSPIYIKNTRQFNLQVLS